VVKLTQPAAKYGDYQQNFAAPQHPRPFVIIRSIQTSDTGENVAFSENSGCRLVAAK
jgi:hypothetical protein